jgi:hypothetical protein
MQRVSNSFFAYIEVVFQDCHVYPALTHTLNQLNAVDLGVHCCKALPPSYSRLSHKNNKEKKAILKSI